MRLVAEKLSVSRSEEPVVVDVTFKVEGGSALVVTGPNGVGKSTLLRAVAGLLRPDSGTVDLEGGPVEAESLREACHYLGHRNGMKRELTVAENLRFWRRFMGPDGGGLTVEEAAETVGLAPTLALPYGYLSAGQQRRIAIARLLVAHRPVWILDEPTAALDVGAEEDFARLVDAHLDRGGLALLATHQPLAIGNQAGFALQSARAVDAALP